MPDAISTTERTLTIEDVVFPGKGLARDDGRVVFVPGALAGERVKVRIRREHKRHADADLVEVLEPSPHRIDPGCPLAGICPGCSYLHVAYEEEVRIKQAQIVSMFEHRLKTSADIFSDPVACPQPLGYRNKITLHAGADREGPLLGYVGHDNRTVLDVPRCPLAVPPINKALRDCRTKPAFLPSLRRGETVVFRYSATDGVVVRIRSQRGWRPVLPREAPSRLTERTLVGTLVVPAGSFFQVNTVVADALVERIMQAIPAGPHGFVIDLYTGSGLFALAARKAGAGAVLGVDRDNRGIRAAKTNARELGITGVEFLDRAAEDAVDDVLGPVDTQETTVIVDPPRRGLDNATFEALCRHRPARLLYVSCGPDTLVRDLSDFQKAGYEIRSAQVLDMFPRTAAFEIVCELVAG
jgi:23S rRNA (uracil1939-C5)-methyltransferase/tRNA (uracil-5-)-methyltransferase